MTNQRNIEIEKLKWQRECHMRYVDRLVKTIKNKKNPSKDFLIKAAGRILSAGLRIKQFEIRLFNLLTAPMAKFRPGGVMPNGPAIVSEAGHEIILTPNHLQP